MPLVVRRTGLALAHWIFGYGSLIWRVDFPCRERRRAFVRGFARRFWQGSRDHRGTPQAPGRVATLIPAPDAECVGVALRVDAAVLAHLDHREKDGYQRVDVAIHTASGSMPGITYIAPAGNPGYLGPAPLDELAAQIRRCVGPSGTNREYLRELDAALCRLGAEDDHVRRLIARVEALAANGGGAHCPPRGRA